MSRLVWNRSWLMHKTCYLLWQRSGERCCLPVSVSFDECAPLTVVDSCQANLCSDTWNTTQTLLVKAADRSTVGRGRSSHTFKMNLLVGGGGSVESENVAALWSNVRIPPQKIEIVPSSTSTSAETSKPGNEKKNYFCISLIKPSKVNLRLNVILWCVYKRIKKDPSRMGFGPNIFSIRSVISTSRTLTSTTRFYNDISYLKNRMS